MHARRPVFTDQRDYCCESCEHARRMISPGSVPDPEKPGGAAYLAIRDRLNFVTSDGEIDPRRLHGAELARWQVTESRAARLVLSDNS